jgi:hypothetical protein
LRRIRGGTHVYSVVIRALRASCDGLVRRTRPLTTRRARATGCRS